MFQNIRSISDVAENQQPDDVALLFWTKKKVDLKSANRQKCVKFGAECAPTSSMSNDPYSVSREITSHGRIKRSAS